MVGRVRSQLALLAVAVPVLARPAPVAACKPPQFVAERLEFALVAARRAGRSIALDGLPATLSASSTPYDHMRVRGVGYLKLVAATVPLPASTERYMRRQRRLARPICAILVYREPATPGRYAPEHDPDRVDDSSAVWAELWPRDVPGVVEFAAARDRMLVTIDRPGDPLALEYRLTRATFASCDVSAGDRGPPIGLLLLALALGRRRAARPR